MSNQSRIEELEAELAVARFDSQPVIIELTKETKDERVFTNVTSGTVRRDCLGGVEPQYEDRPVLRTPERLVDRPWDKEVGKIIKENSDERVIKLASGAIRTDIKTVEEPVKLF